MPRHRACFVYGSLKLCAASGGVRCEQEYAQEPQESAALTVCSSAHVTHAHEQEHSQATRERGIDSEAQHWHGGGRGAPATCP
eukprot:4434724-Pyramimonas_sp.AAC.1